MSLSIRARSTVYFSVMTAAFLLVFQVVLTLAVVASLDRRFRDDIHRNADLLAELFKEELRLNALNEFQEEADEMGIALRVLDERGLVFFTSRQWNEMALDLPVDPAPDGAEGLESEVRHNGKRVGVFTHGVVVPGYGRFTVQVADRKTSVEAARRKMILWGLILMPVMIALALVSGNFFSARALKPLLALRRRAESLRPDDLTARLPVPPVNDEIHALTETLNRALERIEDGYGRMRAFSADAAHELRIPLTAMRGGIEVALRRERTPEEYRLALADALEEAERLSRITYDLLALARAESGELTLDLADVEIRPFLERVVKDINAAHGADQAGPVHLTSAPGGSARFDPEKIQRVLFNLLDNAVKYGGPGKPVRLSARIEDGSVVFSVADSGPGIPPEHQARIFDRFYRVDKARSRAAGGSGLGLAIAAVIARSHGGSLSLKNTSPSGSEFELRIPLETSNPPLKTI